MNTTIINLFNSHVNCYFFGVPAASISTETDAINAIKYFCENASQQVIDVTTEELKTLSEINHNFYEVVNDIIWKTDLPLGSYAWQNRFQLLNAELK